VSSAVTQNPSKSVPNYSTQPTFAESSSYPALIARFAKSLEGWGPALILSPCGNILLFRSVTGRTLEWAQAHFFVAAG
jgi:hypothetical protein